MKFLMFSDLHHVPGAFMGGDRDALHRIQRHAREAGCEFMIHGGDFCHGPSQTLMGEKIADFVEEYSHSPVPAYHALGNHDTDNTPWEEVLRYYNMPDGHYYFDHGGYRMVVCDPNYFYEDGNYIHFSMANNAKYGPYCNYMPPEQLAWLEETIAAAPGPCVLVSHESFEREADGVKNGAEVRRIINDANRRKAGSVLLCMNGHYHRDYIRILDNVCYWDVNSASYDWIDNSHSFYPEELRQKISCISNTLVYNDPLHAVVTLEGNTITIEGMESSMFMGITREMTDNPPCDLSGRPVRPVIQSAKITLG